MNKITIEICYGTLCFVMGGEVFETLPEHLPEATLQRIHLKGMVCPGYCHQQNIYGKPPFVKVEDQLISEANLQKIVQSVNQLINDGTDK